jgi:HEPN domain-containing protein
MNSIPLSEKSDTDIQHWFLQGQIKAIKLGSMPADNALKLLPGFVFRLLQLGRIDKERSGDPEYLWSVLLDDANIRDIAQEYEFVIRIDDQFLDMAKEAIDSNKHAVAVVLIATAVEHLVNIFYRMLGDHKGLSPEVITQVIRTHNIHTKISWLMSLTVQRELSQELKSRINNLIELRNALIHYKAIPSRWIIGYEGSYQKIIRALKNTDFGDLLALPHDLENAIVSILDDLFPERQVAEDISKIMLNSNYGTRTSSTDEAR